MQFEKKNNNEDNGKKTNKIAEKNLLMDDIAQRIFSCIYEKDIFSEYLKRYR